MWQLFWKDHGPKSIHGIKLHFTLTTTRTLGLKFYGDDQIVHGKIHLNLKAVSDVQCVINVVCFLISHSHTAE